MEFTEAESFNVFLRKNKIDLTITLSPDTMINSFIYSNPLFKKCPRKSKTCDKVVKVEDSALTSDVEEICCDWSYTFCFKCTNMPHSPFPCILIAEYIEQCKDYEMILGHNNTICDQCHEVFDVDPEFPEMHDQH
uniref:IBR domain-containing protein n=1 Tax=Panagrolaimus davidi TaxID=227884 RepID=A0A914R8I2_9BILA